MISVSTLRSGVERLYRRFRPDERGLPDVVSVHDASVGRRHLKEVVPLRGAHTLHAQRRHAEGARELTRRLPARRAYRLQNVRVWLDEGIVMTPQGKLVAETLPSHYRTLKRLRAGAYDVAPPARHAMETVEQCTSLKGGRYHGNYYHRWVDEIPRLQALHRLGETPVVTLPSGYPVQLVQMIERLAPAGVRLHQATSREEWVHAREMLYVPPMTDDYCGYLPARFVRTLRKNVVEVLAPDDDVNTQGRRYYVSRAGGDTRRVLNEPAVTRCLSEHGFETVRAETLSIREQVRRFSKADWIVGPHGAGLTNMMFATSCTIVEFFPGVPFTHYRWLSESLGHTYHSIAGESDAEKNADFAVDLSRLRQILEAHT